MKKLVLFLLVFTAFAAVNVYSQPNDEQMKKWQEYMTPGDMHKMLSKGTGSWKAQTTFWMAPSTEPTKSEATANGEMILGGRYLVTKFTGNMMGMPFEGMSIEGYDNAAKTFNSTWIDNMGTGMMNMTGTYDAAAKQTTYTGKMLDPMTGKWCDMREVFTFISDSSTKMEMYGPDESGKEFKTMEIMFTKQ